MSKNVQTGAIDDLSVSRMYAHDDDWRSEASCLVVSGAFLESPRLVFHHVPSSRTPTNGQGSSHSRPSLPLLTPCPLPPSSPLLPRVSPSRPDGPRRVAHLWADQPPRYTPALRAEVVHTAPAPPASVAEAYAYGAAAADDAADSGADLVLLSVPDAVAAATLSAVEGAAVGSWVKMKFCPLEDCLVVPASEFLYAMALFPLVSLVAAVPL